MVYSSIVTHRRDHERLPLQWYVYNSQLYAIVSSNISGGGEGILPPDKIAVQNIWNVSDVRLPFFFVTFFTDFSSCSNAHSFNIFVLIVRIYYYYYL